MYINYTNIYNTSQRNIFIKWNKSLNSFKNTLSSSLSLKNADETQQYFLG